MKQKLLFCVLAFLCLACTSAIASDENVSAKYTFDNGMVLIVNEVPTSPAVAFDLLIKTGSATEGKYLGAGISHFIEHMFFKGTPKRPVGQISKEISALGGIINASTSLDYTAYTIQVPKESFKKGLDVLSDMLMNAVFDSAEIEKERDVILSELRLHSDNPKRELSKLTLGSVFTKHPYGHPIIGYRPILESLTRDDIIDYYKEKYISSNIVFSIAGDVKVSEVYEAVTEAFKDLRPRPYSLRNLPVEPPQNISRYVEREYPTDLTRLALAFPGVSISHPDMYALDVLAVISGKGNSSRLYLDLYKEKSIVYSVSASNLTPVDKGLFKIVCVLEAKNIDKVIQAVTDTVDGIHENGITLEELKKAKRQVLSSHIFSSQTAAGVAREAVFGEAFLGDYMFGEKYVAAINQITKEDVQAVARKYLTKNKLNTVILKPQVPSDDSAKEIKPAKKPEIKKVVLDNGLRVLLREDHAFPLVSVKLVLPGGLRHENEANNGISNLTANLWTKGTKSRSSEDIAKTIESLGASLNSFSGRNSFGLSIDLLSEDIESGLLLLEDLVKNVNFPDEELTKEKARVKSAIMAQDDDIFKKTLLSAKETLFLKHPYGMNILGTPQSIDAINRQNILSFFNALKVPQNMVLAVFGDFNSEEILSIVKSKFSSLKGEQKVLGTQGEPRPNSIRTKTVSTNKEQAIVMVVFQGPKITDNDRYGTEILSSILGSPLTGRIFSRIRDEFGQAYRLGGSYSPWVDMGFIYFYAFTNKDNIEEVKDILVSIIKGVQINDISDKELLDTKTYLKGTFQLSLEKNKRLAFISSLDELYGLGFNNYKSYAKKIDQVTKVDLRRLTADYLDIDKAAIVISIPEGR